MGVVEKTLLFRSYLLWLFPFQTSQIGRVFTGWVEIRTPKGSTALGFLASHA